ncbi:MAG: tetratricopeptide repeat protein [Fimbriimonadaceae bacterium]|nr:tetratricopeptide repeat protein [Fimbriimonadaceae bacterium]
MADTPPQRGRSLGRDVTDFLGQTVANLVEQQPDQALELFPIRAVEAALIRKPHLAVPVFDALLEAWDRRDERWSEVVIQAVAAFSATHRADRTLELAREVLVVSRDPWVRRKAHLYRAFSLAQIRDFDGALTTLVEYERELEEHPDELALHTLLLQRGTFLCQLGRFDEARVCFERTLRFHEGQTDSLGIERLAIVRGKSGICTCCWGSGTRRSSSSRPQRPPLGRSASTEFFQ